VKALLAESTKCKTDVLDARLLSYHDITGLWANSFESFFLSGAVCLRRSLFLSYLRPFQRRRSGGCAA
jgi:hypothetical protein